MRCQSFESSVKSYVVKTILSGVAWSTWFESSVKSYVVKTGGKRMWFQTMFESSVKSYVVKTMLNYGYMG